MAKEGKRIPVRSDGPPVFGHIAIVHGTPSDYAIESPAVRREEITLTPGTGSDQETVTSLHNWAEYFAPSIEEILPSAEHRFMPQRVSIEREVFYRDDDDEGSEDPQGRRVRVTRRRVTLFGTVQ